MKIFFRYLFMRLFQTFIIVLAASAVIWVMADLYGNMDEFLDHKVNFMLVLRFYILRLPQMLVQMLPAAMLFSTLFTLLNLNRRCELVALQSGGMAPLWMFSPFFLFAAIWVVVLAYDMSGPAASAEVTRERLLKQVKGQAVGKNVFENLPYVDNVNHFIWFFQRLDIGRGTAKGLEVLQRDNQGHDMVKYFAREGQWTGQFWRLTGVKEVIYAGDGIVEEQKTYDALDLPDATIPPKQLSLIVSQPEQLTLSQLSQYIATSSQSQDYLAKYRTEWWYRIVYPFSILVLILFALIQGARADRRSALAGVGLAIIVMIAFMMAMNIFMAVGRSNRLPPFIAATATETIFALVGLHLLAVNYGWWWQVHEWWKHWYAVGKRWYDADDEEEPADSRP
jgi:lipopolysaccharide export system permease protein